MTDSTSAARSPLPSCPDLFRASMRPPWGKRLREMPGTSPGMTRKRHESQIKAVGIRHRLFPSFRFHFRRRSAAGPCFARIARAPARVRGRALRAGAARAPDCAREPLDARLPSVPSGFFRAGAGAKRSGLRTPLPCAHISRAALRVKRIWEILPDYGTFRPFRSRRRPWPEAKAPLCGRSLRAGRLPYGKKTSVTSRKIGASMPTDQAM